MSHPKKDFVREQVPRITQLDAVEYEHSIKDILSSQLYELEKFLRPGTISQYRPEIKLLVDVLIYRHSLLRNGRTLGQSLLNIQYSNIPRKSALLYILFNTIFPYIKERYDESWRGDSRRVRSIIDGIWNVCALAQLGNLLQFLRQGRYPTLTDRILKLQHVYINPPNHGVNFSYMMRELLWHNFMEFMKFTLPLINVQALQRVFRSWLGPRGRGVQVAAAIVDLRTMCAVCNLRPNTPCRVSLFCQHVACYICIKSNIIKDEKFCCPQCGESNTAVQELQYMF